jgi:hypothetical protein
MDQLNGYALLFSTEIKNRLLIDEMNDACNTGNQRQEFVVKNNYLHK